MDDTPNLLLTKWTHYYFAVDFKNGQADAETRDLHNNECFMTQMFEENFEAYARSMLARLQKLDSMDGKYSHEKHEKKEHQQLKVLVRFMALLCENSWFCAYSLVNSDLFIYVSRIIISAKEYLPKDKDDMVNKKSPIKNKARIFNFVTRLFLSIAEWTEAKQNESSIDECFEEMQAFD